MAVACPDRAWHLEHMGYLKERNTWAISRNVDTQLSQPTLAALSDL